MKWLIASDLHGSEYYWNKLYAAYEREEADRLLFLGDVLYHGPRNDLPKDYAPKKVLAALNEMKDQILCVRGNCDGEVDQMVLEFPVLAEYALMPAGEKLIFITHGHKFNEKNLPPIKAGDILLHGHTHVPKCVDHGDYIYMNPGSVSMPKEESWNGYMTFDGETFLWKDLEGDVKMEYKIG